MIKQENITWIEVHNNLWKTVSVVEDSWYFFGSWVKSSVDEKRNAFLILIEFISNGNQVDDQEAYRKNSFAYSAGLKHYYKYIEVLTEKSYWVNDIYIPKGVDEIRYSFRIWRPKSTIFIDKDYIFTPITKQAFMQCRRLTRNENGILKEENKKLLTEIKTLQNLNNDLTKQLQKIKSKLKEDGVSIEEASDIAGKEITNQPFSKTIQVLPNNEVRLQGKIKAQVGEKQFAALVQVDFLEIKLKQGMAKKLGLKYSEKLGFYEYLPTKDGEKTNWSIKFRIPEFCQKVKLTFMPWYSNNTIWVSLLEETSVQKAKPKVEQKYTEEITEIFSKKGIEAAEAYILESSLSAHHKADLYEALASLTAQASEGAYCYEQAYILDKSYHRAVKMFRRVVDGGFLRTTKKIFTDFEQKKHSVLPEDHRNIMCAKGYVSLYDRLPNLSIEPVVPILKNRHKVMMFLHTSLPHHSNGYATRSHAILTSMFHNSKYAAEGVTRSGYPFDVGIKEFNAFDEVDGVRYSRLKVAHYYNQPLDEYMRTAADEVEQKLKEEKPSIVHAASAFYTAIPALIAARRLGIPFVYEIRGLWEITRASTIPGWGDTERFKLESALESAVAKEADQVIAITGGIKKELIKRGINANKISIIPNAINKEHFNPLRPNEELRKKIGLKNVPTIGYVGSIVWYEGIEDLLDALEILKKEGVSFNFLLLGDGSALPSIREKVKGSSIEEDVFILGRVPHEEVKDYYSLIDITPFPRKSLEVCEMVSPLKPFEALAQEKVVIASNVDALQEIIDDGKTGLLFQKDSVEDLAKKLKILLNDKRLRKRLAKDGKAWVLSHRDWSQIVPRFDKVYNKAFTVNKEKLNRKIKKLQTIRPVSLLLYGDLNLNYIDGSAIWAASFVEMLAGLKDVSVTFLLKADLMHDTLIESLKRFHNVTIISPSETSKGLKLLKPVDAVEALKELQDEYNFDGVIIRSFEITKSLAEMESFKGVLWPYMIDVFHIKDRWDKKLTEEIAKVIEVSYTVFCQTTHIETFLEKKIPSAKGKTSLLPPMVPDQAEPKKQFDFSNRPFRIVYAGKFDPLWGTREMIAAFKTLRKEGLNIELHAYGDKIHNPPDDKMFKSEIEQALKDTEGIIWHGAQPRKVVIEAMRTYDLAWAWRKPELEENTDEVSTKFLEYSSVGLPMVVIANKITTKLLSSKYPIFANSFDELVPTVKRIIKDPKAIAKASSLVYNASKAFSFSTVRDNYIEPLVNPLHSREKRKIILFAGHDLKFVDKLIGKFVQNGYIVLIDKWKKHNIHDEHKSKALLYRADVIFCEWAMGNAVWYSNHKLPFQKMFVRFHRQEIETDYPAQINYDAVDKMTFIVPHMLRKSIKQYKLEKYKEKCVYIPNYVDAADLDQQKTEDARFNLGIVGIVPKMKRFDRALDILEGLRKKDERYQLFVKGKLAKEYPWMQNRPEEMKYYEEQEKRIENSPHLKGAVHYDGFGKDMGAWFSKIGYILSTSDFEGSHLSVAEAMASGSSPVIIKWDGADEIYPKKYCFDKVAQAVKHVLSETNKSFDGNMLENKVFVEEFDIDVIMDKWSSLI